MAVWDDRTILVVWVGGGVTSPGGGLQTLGGSSCVLSGGRRGTHRSRSDTCPTYPSPLSVAKSSQLLLVLKLYTQYSLQTQSTAELYTELGEYGIGSAIYRGRSQDHVVRKS